MFVQPKYIKQEKASQGDVRGHGGRQQSSRHKPSAHRTTHLSVACRHIVGMQALSRFPVLCISYLSTHLKHCFLGTPNTSRILIIDFRRSKRNEIFFLII